MKEKIINSTGNVFEDIGLGNAAEHLAKAELALEIISTIESRKLTQKDAAKLIGAVQPDISKLKSGQLKGFTIDRLIHFLCKLDRNVQIRVSTPKAKERKGLLETVAA